MIEDEIDKVLNKNFSNKQSNQLQTKDTSTTLSTTAQSNNKKHTSTQYTNKSLKYSKKTNTTTQKITAVGVVLLLFSVATIGLWSPYLMRQNPIQATEQENTAYVTRFSDDSFFSIIALPDTQFYSRNHPEIFINQTQWIVDNKEELNIVYVAHEGDIAQSYNNPNYEYEWQNADAAMSLLEDTQTTDLTHGIPYSVLPGNHDLGEPPGYDSSYYNQYFGVSRFDKRSYYGGWHPSTPTASSDLNDNNYVLFDVGYLQFIAISLRYDPTTDALDWADNVLKEHSSRRAIIISHSILSPSGSWTSHGATIFNALQDNPNVFLMLCGHMHNGCEGSEARRTDIGENGNTITTLLADYQDCPNGGDGWLRILSFYPETATIQVQTYSPYLDEYRTGDASEFTVTYNMYPPLNPLEKEEWELVFSEEFSTGTLDTAVWKTDQYAHFSENWWEPQYYTIYNVDYQYIGDHNLPIGKRDSNFMFTSVVQEEPGIEELPIEGGNKATILDTLSLVYRKEPGLKYFPAWYWNNNGDWLSERDFYFVNQKHPTQAGGMKNAVYGPMNDTSAWMQTNQQFTYGYFEMRCKVPNAGLVLWPAFWLYSGSNPQIYREIDIFEFQGWFKGYGTLLNTPGFNMHLNDNKNDEKRSYPGHYQLIGPCSNVTDYFHTYSVRWTPNVVEWYVDNQPRYVVKGDSPYESMKIIANLASMMYAAYSTLELPAEFIIDYIRAYRSPDKEFLTDWTNYEKNFVINDNGAIGEWVFDDDDVFVTGDFLGDGVDRLLAINSIQGTARLLQYTAASWQTTWHNERTPGYIGAWELNPDHHYKFLSGDFTGNNKDELLAINIETGEAMLLYYMKGIWNMYWSSTQQSGGFTNYISDGTCFVSGDVTGNGVDELYLSNSDLSIVRLYRYSPEEKTWVLLWKNLDTKSQRGLYGDVHVIGDLYGDGQQTLFVVNTQTKNAWLYRFTGYGWNQLWTSGDTGKINGWYINPDDVFIAGDFDGNGKDNLLAFAKNGWSAMATYNSIGSFNDVHFQWNWQNEGSGTINRWRMKDSITIPDPADGGGNPHGGWSGVKTSYPLYFSGYFSEQTQSDTMYQELLCLNDGFGWAHLATYTELP
jgi:beta-glucanase (GH16 family)